MTDCKNLIGCFYMQKSSNGNIFSEFINNESKEIFTESCDVLETQDVFGFEGKYLSTWREADNSIIMSLTIEKVSKSKFKLIWEKNGNEIFEGKGFLKKSELIGYYFAK